MIILYCTQVCSFRHVLRYKPSKWHPPTASSSSMKMTQGAFFLASANSSLTRAAPRPTNSSTNSLAEAAKKGTPASPATALAATDTHVHTAKGSNGTAEKGLGGGGGGRAQTWG